MESAAGSILAFLLSALNEQLSESPTNESPFLSVLMNFNTDTKDYISVASAKPVNGGKMQPRIRLYACGRTLIVFYEYISRPGRDKAKLSCSSGGEKL